MYRLILNAFNFASFGTSRRPGSRGLKVAFSQLILQAESRLCANVSWIAEPLFGLFDL